MGLLKKLFNNNEENKFATPGGSDSGAEALVSSGDILPFLQWVDLREYEEKSLIFNPGGSEKLLKKVADDLAGLFVLSVGGIPSIIDKGFLKERGRTGEDVAAFAEYNIVRLFNEEGNTLQKKIDSTSTLYKITINNRNEASCMLALSIWEELSKQLNDNLFVSVPSNQELNYCVVREGNALFHLINQTKHSYTAAGKNRLSPNIYLFHNSGWKMFDEGVEQIFEYCMEHKLVHPNL